MTNERMILADEEGRGSGLQEGAPCFNCGTTEAADFLIFDTPHHPSDPHSLKLCMACCDMAARMIIDLTNDSQERRDEEEKRTGRPLHFYREITALGYK